MPDGANDGGGIESGVFVEAWVFGGEGGIDEEGRFKGRLKSTGLRPKFLDKLAERGVYVEPELFALESREV